DHGWLMPWARQGVLLLNAVLTVEEGRAGSHQGRGWEGFTDHVVDVLNREREGLVFMLWGSYAQAKGKVIDAQRHRVLRTTHPSPLSAHRGFLGCGHFSAANQYLARRGVAPIDWALPPLAAMGADGAMWWPRRFRSCSDLRAGPGRNAYGVFRLWLKTSSGTGLRTRTARRPPAAYRAWPRRRLRGTARCGRSCARARCRGRARTGA